MKRSRPSALGGPKAIMETKKLVRQMCNIDSEQAFEIATEWSARMFQSEEGGRGDKCVSGKKETKLAVSFGSAATDLCGRMLEAYYV